MKKSFMTRVLAVSLSAAMTFSLSAANMATASAATKNVVLSPSTVTLQYGTSKAKKTLKLKNNSLKWKIKSASVAEKGSTAKGKKLLTISKTSSKVVLQAKNIKKSHKATVTVKVKRTKNKKTYSKTLKCKVTVKPQPTNEPDNPGPDTPTVFTTTVNDATKDRVDLTFTQPVDQATLVPANFKVDAEGVEVTNVEGGDGRNVRLTLSGAEPDKEYTLTITGLTVDGKAVDTQTVKFKTPVETAEGYTLKLESNTNQIKADGYAEALITCEIRDPQGNPVTDKDYTVRFTSDRGSFSRPDSVTVNGVATNILRSEALDVARDVTITAQIIRVEADKPDDANLVGKQATMTVNMTPVLTNIVVNPIEGAESNQADRLTLHFQNPVDDDTYKVNGKIDTDRINIEVYDDISKLGALNTGKKTYSTASNAANKVVNLVPVAGDNKALQVLVDGALTDNRYVGVKVTMTDPNSKKTSTYEESFMLTDSTTPRVLKVEPVSRRQLKVTYSEAVLPQRLVQSGTTGVRATAYAERLENYLIGGRDLTNDAWGADGKRPKITIGSGLDNEDGREVVTITLGEDKYFAPDKYTLTVHNIGDWAACSDGTNNIVTTDSKDFTVSTDDTKPAIESVDVQSPEQILVTFNKPVKKDGGYSVDGKTLDLPVKRTDSNDANRTAKDGDDEGKDSIIQLREGGKDIGGKDGDNPIRVTQVDSEGKQFLIETTKDWSVVYGQRGVYNDDYFNHNYQLYIPANSLVNTDNGEKNTADITYDLSDNAVLKNVDSAGPVIDSNITWNGSEAFVKFNEPVKIRNVNSTQGLNDEGTTVSVKQQQIVGNGNNIQQATAEFVCPGKDTVAGTFDRFTNSTDTEVVVKPANGEILSTGNWTLRISGVSDDYGNTTSGGGNVEVKGTETGFKVAWASVAEGSAYKPVSAWNAGKENDTGNNNGNYYIFVKFTNALNTRSSAVYDMRNYTINSNNGAEIRDAYVKAGIAGYDDSSNITDSITIVIPNRSAYVISENPQNTTLAISNQIVSAAGQSLANNDLEFRLPYNSNVWDDASDAVFGDDDSEIFNRANSDLKTDSAYKEAVEKAIRDGDYRKIILTNDIRDLNISRPVNIDLNGHGLYGTTRASFTDGATCHIYNGKFYTDPNTKSVVSKLDINTPNADWFIEPNGTNNDAGQLGQTVNTGGLRVDEVVLRAIPSKTLVNTAEIGTITVSSGSNDVKIVNGKKDSLGNNGTIEEIVLGNVNKSGTVKIRNYSTSDVNSTGYAIGTITVNSPVKIDITKDSDATVDLQGIANVLVNATKDVELKVADNIVDKLSGTITAVTLKNDKDKVVDSIEGTKMEANTEQGVVDLLKKAFVDAASVDKSDVVSGAAVSKVLVDKNGVIDKNGAAIKGYTVWAECGTESRQLNLDSEYKKFEPVDAKLIPVDNVAGDKKVTIVIKKEGDNTKKITVKDITVTVK